MTQFIDDARAEGIPDEGLNSLEDRIALAFCGLGMLDVATTNVEDKLLRLEKLMIDIFDEDSVLPFMIKRSPFSDSHFVEVIVKHIELADLMILGDGVTLADASEEKAINTVH